MNHFGCFHELKVIDMIFLMHFAFWSGLAGMTVSHTISKRTMKGGFLNERIPDDLFEIESEDPTIFSDFDSPLFPDSRDIALQSFDQAAAVACDGTQSSLDLFLDSPTSLNARDLANEFPGLNDFVAPLDQLQDLTCTAPTSQQPGGSGSGPPKLPGGGDDQNAKLWAAILKLVNIENMLVPGDGCGAPLEDENYKIPLCCNGALDGDSLHRWDFVYGCELCKLRMIPDLIGDC